MKKNKYRKHAKSKATFCQNIANNALVKSLLSIMLTSLVSTPVYVFKNIQNDFTTLSASVVDLVSKNQDAYALCTSVRHPNNLTPFQENAIWNLHREISSERTELLKQQSKLDSHLSQASHLAAGELVCWNNELLASGVDMCQAAIPDSDKIKILGDRILKNIQTDKEKHQHIDQILVDYSRYMAGFFSFNKLPVSPSTQSGCADLKNGNTSYAA